MERKEILEEAARIVTGERQNQYGDVEDSFGLIAGLWGDYLNHPVTSKDVALMMILLKVARKKGGKGKADNWVDIAGYAACGGEIVTEDKHIPGINNGPFVPSYPPKEGAKCCCTDDIKKIAEENERKRELLRAIFGTVTVTDESDVETDNDVETANIADIVKELREISANLYRVAYDLEEDEDE